MLRPLLFSLCCLAAAPVQAGPYTDDLSRCLVDSTTRDDKHALVRWVVTTSSVHPAVRSIARISPEARANASRETARIFERLLVDACLAQTRQAVKFEGAAAIQTGFQTLGQAAMAELFADPAVVEALRELDRQVDLDKLRDALNARP